MPGCGDRIDGLPRLLVLLMGPHPATARRVVGTGRNYITPIRCARDEG